MSLETVFTKRKESCSFKVTLDEENPFDHYPIAFSLDLEKVSMADGIRDASIPVHMALDVLASGLIPNIWLRRELGATNEITSNFKIVQTAFTFSDLSGVNLFGPYDFSIKHPMARCNMVECAFTYMDEPRPGMQLTCGSNLGRQNFVLPDGQTEISWKIDFEYQSAKTDVGCIMKSNPTGLSNMFQALSLAKETHELHDFVLKCGGKKFPCNKFVLMARSDVFKAMLSHSDTAEVKHNMMVIEDTTPVALGIFVDFLYLGWCNIPNEQARSLYELGDKYNVKDVMEAALKQLKASTNTSNAIDMVVLGHLHSDKDLMDFATNILKANLAELKRSNEFKKLDPSLQNQILLACLPDK